MSSKREPATFALVGAAGYIAPRHMQAIAETGGTLALACDVSDSVGVIDRWAPDAEFHITFETFASAIAARRERGEPPITHVSVCSPNHLHAAHAAAGLRFGADVICEKPLVLDVRQLDELAAIEAANGRRIFSILQLRHHPAILALKEAVVGSGATTKHEVVLSYITSRGRWYDASWKADIRRSGGIAMNIGIHFFDMLGFVFGRLQINRPHWADDKRAAGFLEFERARVRWFLSIDRNDLPPTTPPGQTTYRSIRVSGREVEFSGGFTDLHTVSYREILAGRGFGLDAARPSLEAAWRVHNGRLFEAGDDAHPFLVRDPG